MFGKCRKPFYDDHDRSRTKFDTCKNQNVYCKYSAPLILVHFRKLDVQNVVKSTCSQNAQDLEKKQNLDAR